MLLGPAADSVTSSDVARSRRRSRHGPTEAKASGRSSGPACLPLRSISTSVSLPTLARLKASLVRVDPRLQALQAVVHDLGRYLVLHRCGRSSRAAGCT